MEREPLTKYEMPTHWNSPEVLAPVGTSLWIRTPQMGLVKATRTRPVVKRGDELEYQLDRLGIKVKGLFQWAYP